MKANIGLIIAAGKQSRFNNDYPKALVSIGEKCLLDINYENMKMFCERVYVVCSFENEHYFDNTKYKKIVINSGKGSGDAVLRALKVISYDENDTIFIMWGDALIKKELFDITLKNFNNIALIPCIREENPYVQIKENEETVTVLFSKYKEPISEGFHDMCLFLFLIKDLFNSLLLFYKKFYNDTFKLYVHKHGKEFEFLDIFNDANMKAKILELDESYKTLSFNTIEELKNIKESKL